MSNKSERLTIRLNPQDQMFIENIRKVFGGTKSDSIKNALFITEFFTNLLMGSKEVLLSLIKKKKVSAKN